MLLTLILVIPNDSSIIWRPALSSLDARGGPARLVAVSATYWAAAAAEAASHPPPPDQRSHLDAISRLTTLINHLVDALIDKATFMAEIVIESAQSEQCEASCYSGAGLTNRSSLLLTASEAKRMNESMKEVQLDNRRFLIDSLSQANKELNSDRGINDKDNMATDCSMFNVALDSRDLPVEEMKYCCRDRTECYAKCGSDKLACDAKFHSCLKSLCKEKFDYQNKTVVYQFNKQLYSRPDSTGEPSMVDVDLNDRDLVFDDEDERLRGRGDASNDDVDDEEEEALYKSSRTSSNRRTTKQRLRDKFKACKLASKVLIIGNLAFACQAYKQAQWLGCKCELNYAGANKTMAV